MRKNIFDFEKKKHAKMANFQIQFHSILIPRYMPQHDTLGHTKIYLMKNQYSFKTWEFDMIKMILKIVWYSVLLYNDKYFYFFTSFIRAHLRRFGTSLLEGDPLGGRTAMTLWGSNWGTVWERALPGQGHIYMLQYHHTETQTTTEISTMYTPQSLN